MHFSYHLTPLQRQMLCKTLVGSLAILALMALTAAMNWDPIISHYYAQKGGGHFGWERSWWFHTLLHQDTKRLLIIIGVFILLRLIYLARQRRFHAMLASGYVLTAALLSLRMVNWIRSHNPAYCPRDLLAYGGAVVHDLSPWGWASDPAGQCWPSGHASAGYCLLAFYFWLSARRSPYRWPALTAVMAFGALMSWTQLVRGAHFLNHTNASLLICWVVCGLVASLWWRHRAPVL